MKKYMLTIIISLLIGFLLSNYILKKYDGGSILPTFKENYNVYLIQQGVYSSFDSMKKNTSNLTDYIYSEIDNLFYVYVGLTLDTNNIVKIQNYYKDSNIKTIVKNTTMNDSNFHNSLMQYDEIMNQTEDNTTISELIKQVLRKYKGEE